MKLCVFSLVHSFAHPPQIQLKRTNWVVFGSFLISLFLEFLSKMEIKAQTSSLWKQEKRRMKKIFIPNLVAHFQILFLWLKIEQKMKFSTYNIWCQLASLHANHHFSVVVVVRFDCLPPFSSECRNFNNFFEEMDLWKNKRMYIRIWLHCW